MKKQTMVICAPFTTRSGYGDHARDLFHSFYDLDRYEISLIDVRWGDTPRNALDKNNPKDKLILDRFIYGNPDSQPDIYVDIRIPNEFLQFGKYNIGITAGVETSGVSQNWLECCNKMDLVIVPSEHSRMGFVKSVYDKIQSLPNGQQQKVGEMKLVKPMEVLFEGIDDKTYKSLKGQNLDEGLETFLDEEIKEDFAFLVLGQWVKGNYGEDRKDIARTVKVFFESFVNEKKKPALILKTSGANFSLLDREDILSKLKSIKSQFPDMIKDQLPNVYLLHGDLTRDELNTLYNHKKIKSLVSFTHGEGFGRPMLEATFAGLPVIASNWSGQVDFLDENYSVLLGGELQQVPESAVWENIIIPQSQWFNVNEVEAGKALQFVYKNIYEVQLKAKKLEKINRERFTHSKMTEELGKILDKHVKTQVEFKLPKLQKVKESNSPQVDMSDFDNFFEGHGAKPNEYIEGVE